MRDSFVTGVCLVAVLVWVAVASAQAPKPANPAPPAKPKTWLEQPIDDATVNLAIQRAVAYLWQAAETNPNKTFNWESLPLANYVEEMKKPPAGIHTAGGIYGGQTALVLLALAKANANNQDDERYRKALKTILELEPRQTYARGLRGALLATINRPDRPATNYSKIIEADKQWLLDGVYIDGSYGYFQPANKDAQLKPTGGRDLSNTQYGVLGMWLISDYLFEVPAKYWQIVQSCYLTNQNPAGGWPYGVGDKQGMSLSMTLGGLASLYLVWDRLYTEKCGQAVNPDLIKAIDRGQEWLGKNFKIESNAFILYIMYGVERVGVASGLKYFGDKNWWDMCARYVLFTQQPNGSWPTAHVVAHEPVTTAWALLFLSYGRAPVVFNKLAYGPQSQWNTRPRDLARLMLWMDKEYERLFNWQVMPIDRSVEELLDAPILLMTGKTAIHLKPEQKQKLKQYVLGGGLLFGEASDSSVIFANSFRSLVKELFPELEMTTIRETHGVYTLQDPKIKIKPALLPLEGLSNGIRTMVMLSPKDLGCAWQQNAVKTGEANFHIAGNLMKYVSDKGQGLLGRGTSYMAKDLGRKPARQVTIGRLAWSQSKYVWDPEPAGWQRMDVSLRNANIAGLATTQCDLAEPLDAAAVPVLHATGTSAIVLTDAQKANLKKYVADGGLLLADAAGGSKQFAESFDKLAGELFAPLIAANPDWLKEALDEKGAIRVRHVGDLPYSTKPIQLLGWQQDGRWAVLSLPYDLSAAMVAYPNIEPVGLSPASAEKFVAAMVKSLSKATTKPAN
ncbi:MAG: DUF4159 domain-containing protein [Phycisphaerae bacterium]|nr:DUF4159 domain-containing protein [Phycisphaerae bacterium]